MSTPRRSQWPSDLRREFTAARMLELEVRIPPGPWISVSYNCCVLSGTGLCVGLITRPENLFCLYWCKDYCHRVENQLH